MKKTARNLFLLAVTLTIVGVLLYHSRGAFAKQGFSWSALAGAIRQTRISLVLLAAAAIYVCYAIRSQRWIAFSRYLGRARFLNVLTSTLMGFSAVFFLGRAGEPVRPLLIARKDRLSISGTFGIYVLERIFDVAATLTLFGLGLTLATSQLTESSDTSAILAIRGSGLFVLVLLAAIIGFLVYFRLHGAGWIERRAAAWSGARGWRRRVALMLVGFSEGLQGIRTWRDLLEAIGYSTAHWGLVVLSYLWVCHSFGGKLAQLGMADAMLLLGLTMLGGIVQLPAIGGGAQAASFFALTALFGIAPGPAFAAAIVLWLVTFASVLVPGVPLLIHQGLSMHELWELASESRREVEIVE
ncbi:MAG TPA: lysylphosphatidylglycerol synthase transmembrane domain-containing protein, partial [Candidatus Dormibacteraeota bacterium]|nr:lysylphosphatidylglycerol synthase transmembrane domain-containing protein [Candidatus Dormibacteraeota bacterium]